jgi:hypothetical protein
MIKNNFWESLVWIIIWVFILSFIIFWIVNLLLNSKSNLDNYENIKTINILKNNTENVINVVDTSSILESEIFYLYKNTVSNTFNIFTWALNEEYKYIDQYWNKIDDLNWFIWNIYTRTLSIKRKNNSLWLNIKTISIDIQKYNKN